MLNACREVGRLTKFQATLVLMAVIVAKGGKFGEPKASKALADIFVVLLPLKRVELKHRHTSGIMKWPAMSSESSRFSRASFLRSAKGT